MKSMMITAMIITTFTATLAMTVALGDDGNEDDDCGEDGGTEEEGVDD